MTLVRSNKEVLIADGPAARKHARRTAKNQAEESADVARARNTHYLQQARAYEIDTGDSPNVLRAKRRWVNEEYKAHRDLGKPVRELHDFYSKRNITKPKDKRPKFEDLSDKAKELNSRLEDALAREPKPVADAGDGSPAVSDKTAVKKTQKSSKRGKPAPKAAVSAATKKPSAAEIAAAREQGRIPDLSLRFRRPATRGSSGGNAGEDVEMGGTDDADVVELGCRSRVS